MLPIQGLINEFGNLEFANDFLREKFRLRVIKEPVYTNKLDTLPSDTFYLYNTAKNVSNFVNITNDAHNLILNNNVELVSIGTPHITELKEEYADLLNWKEAWAEEKIRGVPIIAYEYKDNWFLQTPESPKAKNVIPTRNSTYHMAVCHFLMKHFSGDSIDTVLYHFNKNYFYHMIYTNIDWATRAMDALTLVSATDRRTLKVVSDSKLMILAAEVRLDVPPFSIVGSFNDAMSYLNSVDSNTVFIKDNTSMFKLTKGRS